VVLFVGASCLVVAAAGAHDQELVLFYAVSVFLSFLAGLLAMAVFSRRDHRPGLLVLNLFGAVVVAFTLVVNLARGLPLVSLAASLAIAGGLYRVWVRAGRPGGIRDVAAEAESDVDNQDQSDLGLQPESISDDGIS
jgi:peptidoglycan/LPS O-acetylase OafA/YrhL